MARRIPGADAVVRSASRRGGRVRSGELALATVIFAVIFAAARGAATAAGSSCYRPIYLATDR